jgi:glycosyltransferase involved in cell wall biosynthesis
MIPLIVDLETEWRGGQNQAVLLLKGLYERGHAAELIAVKGSSLQHRARKEGIYVHTVSRKIMRLSAAAKIRSVLSDGRVDLIHVNESHALTAAWLAGAHRKIPLIISRRVGYPLGKSLLARARYRAASCIIANSQWVAEQAAASGADPGKLRVVYEGVAIPARVTAEQRSVARMRWGVNDTGPLLGCVSVLLPDKGQEYLIRALAKLRKEIPNARLLLAGAGEYRRELEQLASTLNLSSSVIFTGFVRDIESVYEAIDVFLFPALFEGLGTSLLAAMGYAIPSIAFRRCAFPEIIEDEKSGLLVEEPGGLLAAMKKLVTNHELARRIAEEGRNRVEHKFSVDKMVDATLAVYEEVLSRTSA